MITSTSAAALACAVCYGNAEDPMVKGAVAGVAVLGAFIFFVLVVVAAIGIRFGRRSRSLARAAAAARSPAAARGEGGGQTPSAFA